MMLSLTMKKYFYLTKKWKKSQLLSSFQVKSMNVLQKQSNVMILTHIRNNMRSNKWRIVYLFSNLLLLAKRYSSLNFYTEYKFVFYRNTIFYSIWYDLKSEWKSISLKDIIMSFENFGGNLIFVLANGKFGKLTLN